MNAFSCRRRPSQIPFPALLILLIAGMLSSSAAPPEPIPEILTPDQVGRWVEVMRTNHPALAAATQRSRAATLNAAGIRRFEDPEVRFGGAIYSPRGMNPAEQGNLVYGIEQKLPILGKETAARERAEAQAGAEAARTAALLQEFRRDLAGALFTAALAERAVALGRDDLKALEAGTTSAENRTAAGDGSSVDVLRLQSEVARRSTELQAVQQGLEAARAAVNRWLGRPPESPLPSFALPEPAPTVTFSPYLVALALKAEPRLRVLDQERSVAAADLTVSRRQRRPDLGVGVEGWQYAGDGGFRQGMFTVSLNLPWFNRDRYRRDIHRDEARLEAARLDTQDRELAVSEEIFRLTTRLSATRSAAVTYRDTIRPRATAAYAAALGAWTSGRGSLTDVLDTRRARLDAELEEARAIAEQWTALSELLLCCGLEEMEALWEPPAAAMPASGSVPHP